MSIEFRLAEPGDYADVIDVMGTVFLERVDVAGSPAGQRRRRLSFGGLLTR